MANGCSTGTRAGRWRCGDTAGRVDRTGAGDSSPGWLRAPG